VQFTFDNQTLDTERRELLRDGAPIPVQPQVFDLLVYLVQNRERVVSKDDLIGLVWAAEACPIRHSPAASTPPEQPSAIAAGTKS
jgi:DNA-binding winged-HTH domains